MLSNHKRNVMAPMILVLLACATRKSNESTVREVSTKQNENEFTNVQIDRTERDRILALIRERIDGEKEAGSQTTLKWGRGAPACASNEFAFGLSKQGYEPDTFELRTKFENSFLKKVLELPSSLAEEDTSLCTDTRQSRPMIVLSTGIESAQKDSLQLSEDELKPLGVTDGVAKEGEVILANFFHRKRFWIARISLNGVEKTFLQLEHFPVLSANNEEKKYNEDLRSGNISSLGTIKQRFASWANNNVAGHSQMRAQFKKESPVVLYEQVILANASALRQTRLRDIVLSSEAQGTLAQVGPNGYDPVKARSPLFFSINKIVSLHEKYSDMIVRQRHWVEQFHLHIDGSQKNVAGDKQQEQTENPSFAEVFTNYMRMSRKNWQAMTKQKEKEQDPAVYRTLDLTPPTPFITFIKNRTRNCATEVITALEVDGRGKGAKARKAWWQDVTLKRAYPMFLGLALDELGLIELDTPEPGMDSDGSLNGDEKLKATDESLAEVREHFANKQRCEVYFGNANDKAKCLSWKQVILPSSRVQ